MKIKKEDKVLIIHGDDKGKKGKVLKSYPKIEKILVEGVNIVRKHSKAKRQGEKGQIIETPKPVSVSNVKLVCPKCQKSTKIGYQIKNGKKFRVCKKCGSEI